MSDTQDSHVELFRGPLDGLMVSSERIKEKNGINQIVLNMVQRVCDIAELTPLIWDVKPEGHIGCARCVYKEDVFGRFLHAKTAK